MLKEYDDGQATANRAEPTDREHLEGFKNQWFTRDKTRSGHELQRVVKRS